MDIKHLFITGMPGSGKSTFLIRELGNLLPFAAGYGTVRMLDCSGKLSGFFHVKASEYYSVNISGDTVSVESFMIPGEKRVFRPEIFRKQTLPLIESAGKFVFIDEVGGKELADPVMFQEYRKVLHGNRPGIWVLKSPLHAGSFDKEAYAGFRKLIEETPGALILEYSREKEGLLKHYLQKWREDNGLDRSTTEEIDGKIAK